MLNPYAAHVWREIQQCRERTDRLPPDLVQCRGKLLKDCYTCPRCHNHCIRMEHGEPREGLHNHRICVNDDKVMVFTGCTNPSSQFLRRTLSRWQNPLSVKRGFDLYICLAVLVGKWRWIHGCLNQKHALAVSEEGARKIMSNEAGSSATMCPHQENHFAAMRHPIALKPCRK